MTFGELSNCLGPVEIHQNPVRETWHGCHSYPREKLMVYVYKYELHMWNIMEIYSHI